MRVNRPTVTPMQVMEAFRSGKSTADIARDLLVPEASIYRLFVIAREAQRLFHDPDNPITPALDESAVAQYERWRRLSFPEVHGVEDASNLADSSAGERQKDYRPVQTDDAGS
jgi:hypothetical protein